MAFLLGCNYWASHAGTEMWRQWDEAVVAADFEALARGGVQCLRVFPNWRDFQPVKPLYASSGGFREYRMENEELPGNPDYLDAVMLERFHRMCAIAQEHGIQLIVGLLTGWMSGRLFIPAALNDRNLFTDPVALLFQQRFIRGFVADVKNEAAIYAWDFGNECNCMGVAESREEALHWALTISNAIRAADATRPIVSGMHSLGVEGPWRIADQAEASDILTTHPYPYWVPHCAKDRTASIRTLLHATAESRYYRCVGGKPCLVEEIGTMGPMLCDDETAAGFLRVNLFSNWAHGAEGVLWWCAHDQDHLETAPYSWNMCERELGMLSNGRRPKPVLREMERFGSWLRNRGLELPPAQVDGVCIVSRGQDQWGVAYMSYILAKQAGANLDFAWCEADLPDVPVYLLPSVNGHLVMDKRRYDQLKARVYDGATLYISMDDGILTEFETLTGLRVTDSESVDEVGEMQLGGAIPFTRRRRHHLENISAQVLAEDGRMPAFTVHPYGKGRVFYLNLPLESMLLAQSDAFDGNRHQVYRRVFAVELARKALRVENPMIGVTLHPGDNGTLAVLVNYSDQPQETGLTAKVGEVLYGHIERIDPLDACVIALGHA